jgi:hypothetical protein
MSFVDCQKTRKRLIWPNAIGFLSIQAFYDKPQLIELEAFQALVRFRAQHAGEFDRPLRRHASAVVERLSDADSRRQSFGEDQSPIKSVAEH